MNGAESPRPNARQKALGVIIGVAGALLVFGVAFAGNTIVVVYVLAFTLGLPVIFGIVIGVGMGLHLARKGTLPTWPWPVLVLLALVAWPGALVAPLTPRTLKLRAMARALPMPSDAAQVTQHVQPYGDDNYGPWVRVLLHSGLDTTALIPFYETALARDGWEQRADDNLRIESFMGTRHWFHRPGRLLSVRFRDDTGGTRVEVTAIID